MNIPVLLTEIRIQKADQKRSLQHTSMTVHYSGVIITVRIKSEA